MVLIFLIGPPAVGKMAVGIELKRLMGYKLLVNHDTIELALKFFDYGSKKFNILNGLFRRRILEEVASSDLKGLIYTYVTSLDLEEEKAYLDKVTQLFNQNGRTVYYIELEADLSERLRRNRSKSRIEAKPSKGDVESSERNLLNLENKYVLNSNEEYPFFYSKNYIKIDNTKISPREVALQIINAFNLK
ncbi:MAG: shikimate kinase [Candidatus Thorarchaeota archaeon]